MVDNIRPVAIELHIDALVLSGLAAGQQQAIAAAIQHELTRLIAAGGIADFLTQSGSIPSLDGGSFTIAPDAAPKETGARIAGAISSAVASAFTYANHEGLVR
jgi:hypothetical protein